MRFILRVVVCICVLSVSVAPGQVRPPNVVILLSDDQGWGDLSISGNANLRTPNIDRLGQEGAFLERFYVQPVCSPTRAELLTGRYHPRSGVYSTSEGGERINLDETTLADYFRQAGYKTAAFGKWHSGMQYPYHPNGRGFDEFYGFCSGHWGDYFSPMLEHNGALTTGNGFLADDLAERAMDFMEKNQAQPFLLYVPFNTPHSPMQVPDRWWKKFAGKSLGMKATDPGKEEDEFTRAALAMCENLDWNVGRMMQKLKDLKLDDNTIVLYFSDNGPNSFRWNGGMKGRKGSTDEGGVRSPLLIRYPAAVRPGQRIREVTGAVDLLPTLADLCGIRYSPPQPLDGQSFSSLLTGGSGFDRDRLLYAYWNKQTSVRYRQYRLDSRGMLYDIEADPAQLTDLSSRLPEVADRLRQAVQKWQAEVLPGIQGKDGRTFPVGHPDFVYSQLPARDARFEGNVRRSSPHPNCSFLTNWKSPEDVIQWDVEVLEEGDFAVEVYYTCAPEHTGATFRLSFGPASLSGRITVAHNPPLRGMEHDRIERIESYVKDFRPLPLGTIHLSRGKGALTLRAEQIPGAEVMDLRLLMLKRVK